MKLALVALCSAGCATSWIATQASGTQRVWDESVTEASIPQPGIQETLAVSVPLGEPVLSCRAWQVGRDLVAHSAFRYGRHWKIGVLVSVALEGALGALFLLAADNDTAKHQANYLYGGYFALDAAIALPTVFIPRREIYREEPVSITTPIRTDCPEGLALDIGGESYPVDPLGHLGELGATALGEWMTAPHGELRATFDGQVAAFRVGAYEQCAWQRAHPGATVPTCSTGTQPPTSIDIVFHVTPGTLTKFDPRPVAD